MTSGAHSARGFGELAASMRRACIRGDIASLPPTPYPIVFDASIVICLYLRPLLYATKMPGLPHFGQRILFHLDLPRVGL